MKLNLKQFVNRSQLQVMRDLCKGEEGEHFVSTIETLKNTIATMPATYDTDGQGDAAIVHLHYFTGASDWWITERDCEQEQLQAFGFVCLNGWVDDAELGYISIDELIKHGAELDLYWNPKTVGEIKAKLKPQQKCNMTESELTLAFAEGLFTDDEYIAILGDIRGSV